MPSVFAAIASILWGGSDFLGGMAAKRLDVRRVGVVAEATGVVVIALFLSLFPAHPSTTDLCWGIAAGVATAAGVMMFYAALAIGPMYIAATIMAVVGAASNAVLGLLNGERPSGLALIGVPLAIVSLVLVSASPSLGPNSERVSPNVLTLAVGAGLTFGVLNACFAATSPDSGSWPVAASRLVATIILGVAAWAARDSGRWHAIGVRYSVTAGFADAAATASIAYALQRGSQVLIGVLGSLFPVVTVLLARIFLQESMRRRQAIGLVCAVASVALISSS